MSLLAKFRASLLGQGIVTVSGALLIIILARLLDAEEYGLLFLAISTISVIQLFAKLGIGKSSARYISEYKEGDRSQVPHIIKTSIIYNSITIGIVSVITIIYSQEISQLIGEPDLSTLLFIGVGYIIFGTITTYIRLILQGFENIELSIFIHAIGRLSRLLFGTGFVVLGYGATGALSGYVVGFIISSSIGLYLLYNIYQNYPKKESIESGLRKRIAEYTIPLTATSTAKVLDSRLDTVLIGFFLNPLAVTYYTVGKQVVQFIETPAAALGFTLSPTFSAEKASGNIEQASRVYESALINSLLFYLPAAAGLVLVAEPLIELVFGGEYLGAAPILQIFGIYIIMNSMSQITSNALDYLGRARARSIIKVSTSVANVIMNIILIPIIGVIGAAIATVFTYSVYTIFNIYIIGDELMLDWKLILSNIIKISIITLLMASVVYLLTGYVSGWITLFATIITGSVIWLSLSLISGMMSITDIKSLAYG